MNFKFNKTTKVYDCNYLSPRRINVNQGGTSSSKTYSLMQVLDTHAIEDKNAIITVVGQDIPNLKKGPWRDQQFILGNEPWLNQFIRGWNKTDRLIEFVTGSVIEFNSYADTQDAKQGKRDYLFVTECQGISYDIFMELAQRTSKKIYLDYNPSAEFWVHEKLLQTKGMFAGDVRFIKSSFKNNPFIAKNVLQQILSYELNDPYRWKVYGLGELGAREGLIFPDWEEADFLPQDWDWKVSGIDFGYFNTPTALIDIYKNGNNLYFDERLYQTDLLLKELVGYITENYSPDSLFYADSAEPKMIAAMRRESLNVGAALKGPDSIVAGINTLKEYKCHYTRRSINIRKERLNYEWAKAGSKYTNVPIDDWNHSIDAIRYGVYTHKFAA